MIAVVAAVIERDDCFLVTRRPQGVHLAGMWEFPGGKIAPGESHAAALEREIDEELGAPIDVGALILTVTHAYEDADVTLHFYACKLRGTPASRLGQEIQWVARKELAHLAFPAADADLIKQLTTSAAR